MCVLSKVCWRAVAIVAVASTAVPSANAAIVTNEVEQLAIQSVNLLGIDATLVAQGIGRYTFDVDANNNTIPGGNSDIEVLFQGQLPIEFEPLGFAGAPFDLYTLTPEILTVTGNGTRLRLETNFGIDVYAAPNVVGATFFTSTLSVFESDIVGLNDFTGAIFQDPNRPNDSTPIFVGDSLPGLGLPAAGTQVGVSFNRTVTAVPEPSSLLLCCSVLGLVSIRSRRRYNH